MTSPEDKIRKLLALAAHPNTPVEEARTAALSAARLMAENKVEVGVAGVPAFDASGRIFGQPIYPSTLATIGALIHTLIEAMVREQPAPVRRPPPPRTPFDELFWERWAKQNPPAKKKRRRSKRKNNSNRKRKQ